MRKLLMIFCTVLSIACFLYIGVWFLDGQRQRSKDSRMAEQFHELIKTAEASGPAASPAGPDASAGGPFAGLQQINQEVIGWLTIENTAIDYPVVRGDDNERYLTTGFAGEESRRGTIFSDYRCQEKDSRLILYGHHMKDKTMFHDLAGYRDTDFLEAHKSIRFYPVAGGKKTYQVVDVRSFDTAKEHRQTFFEQMSGLDYGGGELLILTTCDNTIRTARIVVVALLTE